MKQPSLNSKLATLILLVACIASLSSCKSVFADDYFVTWERNGTVSGEFKAAGQTIMNEMTTDLSTLTTTYKPQELVTIIGQKFRLQVGRVSGQDKDAAVRSCSDAANVRILDTYSQTSSTENWYVTKATKDKYDLYVIVNIEYESTVPLRTVAAYYYNITNK